MGTKIRDTKNKQMKAVRLRLTGATWKAIAKQVDVSLVTLERWRQQEGFINEMKRQNDKWLKEIEATASYHIDTAFTVLIDIATNKKAQDYNRILACDKVLGYIYKNQDRVTQSNLAKLALLKDLQNGDA